MKNTKGTIENERPSGLRRGWLHLLVILLIAGLSVLVVFPWRILPADAAADQFSGGRAMEHLAVIASEPHPQNSPAQEHVRDYLKEQLSGLGYEVEIQRSHGVENVVARLPGTDPTGSIVILAHYDSPSNSPGAGDNGSGVAVLLEVMDALSERPAPRNTIIALFDDGEELPDEFSGSKAFVRESPWMENVQVAISLDSAVAGPISINETGPGNAWLMPALARSYNGGAWTSMSGGGNYDCTPFRNAGVQVIALESNYPFWQKHTPKDTLDIVRPASVQQMGDQTLAIARELGDLDLTNLGGNQETFFQVFGLGFIHYPETWTLPFVIAAAVLFVGILVAALRSRQVTLRGLAVALGSILATTAISAVGVGALWPRLPDLLGWETNRWPEWPEVIPPHGGWVDLIFALLILVLAIVGYRLARRWSKPMDFSIAGLLPFLLAATATAFAAPRGSYLFTWPVLISLLGWIAAWVIGKKRTNRSLDLVLLVTASAFIIFILPFLPGVVMADGMKSLAILAGVEALILGVVLPAVDSLLVRRTANVDLYPLHTETRKSQRTQNI